MMQNNMTQNNSCPYNPKVVRQKTAKKEPIGSFYHPTEKTYRDGKCPCGFVSKKGYQRHAYDKKDGTHVKHTYVHRTCIPNKGTPGKVLDKFKPFHLEEKNSLKPYNYKTTNNGDTRFKKLLSACKELSYRTVVLRLSQLRTLTKMSDPKHSAIYDEDMKRLKEWRIENPNLYKPVNGNEGVKASVNANEGVKKPVNGNEGVKAPVNGNEGVKEPVNGNKGVKAPVNGNKRVKAPVNGNEGVKAPVNSNKRVNVVVNKSFNESDIEEWINNKK
jgi:hypothetical protein